MDRYQPGMLAQSVAGHDLRKIYVIIRVEEEYVYLVDGRLKTVEKPKKKNKKHIQLIRKPQKEITKKLTNGQKIENEEIKRAIKQYLREQ